MANMTRVHPRVTSSLRHNNVSKNLPHGPFFQLRRVENYPTKLRNSYNLISSCWVSWRRDDPLRTTYYGAKKCLEAQLWKFLRHCGCVVTLDVYLSSNELIMNHLVDIENAILANRNREQSYVPSLHQFSTEFNNLFYFKFNSGFWYSYDQGEQSWR